MWVQHLLYIRTLCWMLTAWWLIQHYFHSQGDYKLIGCRDVKEDRCVTQLCNWEACQYMDKVKGGTQKV
jgi:hypothetical protein